MAITKEALIKAIHIRKALNCNNRAFVFTTLGLESYEVKYKYMERDIKYKRIADDTVGNLSDTFLLYAVSVLRMADKDSIKRFLIHLARTEPDLGIPIDTYMKHEDVFWGRLKALHQTGFLFKHCTSVSREISENSNKVKKRKKPKDITLHEEMEDYELADKFEEFLTEMEPETGDFSSTLYSVSEDTQVYINMALGLSTKPIKWIQRKRLPEILGYGAASYVAVRMMESLYFKSVGPAVLATKYMGTFFLASEIYFTKDTTNYKVGVEASYMVFLSHIQTKTAYKEFCIRKINVIKNYLHAKQSERSEAAFVCVVQDNEDLMNFADLIISSEILLGYLGQIYFTGEGALMNSPDGYLKMFKDNNSSTGFNFYQETPVFLSDRRSS